MTRTLSVNESEARKDASVPRTSIHHMASQPRRFSFGNSFRL